MHSIKKNLKNIRQQKKISQRTLARLSGVSQSYISKVEQGSKTPSLKVIDLLSTALGCSQIDIIGKSYFKENSIDESNNHAYGHKEVSV